MTSKMGQMTANAPGLVNNSAFQQIHLPLLAFPLGRPSSQGSHTSAADSPSATVAIPCPVGPSVPRTAQSMDCARHCPSSLWAVFLFGAGSPLPRKVAPLPMLQIDKLRHQGWNRLSRSPSDGAVVLEREWESGAEFCLSLVMLWRRSKGGRR